MPIVDIYLLSALGIGLLGRPTPAQAARQGGLRPAADGDQLRRARGFAPPGAGSSRRSCSGRRCRSHATARRARASCSTRGRDTGAVDPRGRPAVPRRDRRDAVVHLAVPLAHHRADVERVRDPRHRSARPAPPRSRRRERERRAVAADAALSERVDADGPDTPRAPKSARCSSGSRASPPPGRQSTATR